ncbi:uncharacterized protein LOC135834659 [Planococcus citri]|uniref:uncharacterized protein LOC135834659 n=1 Tax=Planococcus citri TaxID=170843 RepID=UPI0031F9EC45
MGKNYLSANCFKMVKVKEFCCGFSLRSGTYIAAWGLLVWSSYLFIQAVYYYMHIQRLFTQYHISDSEVPKSWSLLPYLLAYDVTRTTTGITVSLIAIWALQKNKSKFLNGLLWYLYYSITFTILEEILLIFAFDLETFLLRLNPTVRNYLPFDSESEGSDEIALVFLIYLFGIGAASYFTLIVKSYRDYSLRNEAHNVQYVGPDATTIGYIRS